MSSASSSASDLSDLDLAMQRDIEAEISREYLVLKRLAEGNDGVCLLALPKSLLQHGQDNAEVLHDKVVCVKYAKLQTNLDDFQEEYQKMLMLPETNGVAKCIDAGSFENKSHYYFVLEWIRGGTVDKLLEEDFASKTPPAALIWGFLADLLTTCLALREGHGSIDGLIHQDIHLGNILYRTSHNSETYGDFVLVDFGHAVAGRPRGASASDAEATTEYNKRRGQDIRLVVQHAHVIAHSFHRHHDPRKPYKANGWDSDPECKCERTHHWNSVSEGELWHDDELDEIIKTFLNPEVHDLEAKDIEKVIQTAARRRDASIKKVGGVQMDWIDYGKQILPLEVVETAVKKWHTDSPSTHDATNDVRKDKGKSHGNEWRKDDDTGEKAAGPSTRAGKLRRVNR